MSANNKGEREIKREKEEKMSVVKGLRHDDDNRTINVVAKYSGMKTKVFYRCACFSDSFIYFFCVYKRKI